MRMIREPCEASFQASSAPCSELDRSQEQFHGAGAAAQHAAAERSAPRASAAPLPGDRRPLPGAFETDSYFILCIYAVRNCQPRRKPVAARNFEEASPRCTASI